MTQCLTPRPDDMGLGCVLDANHEGKHYQGGNTWHDETVPHCEAREPAGERSCRLSAGHPGNHMHAGNSWPQNPTEKESSMQTWKAEHPLPENDEFFVSAVTETGTISGQGELDAEELLFVIEKHVPADARVVKIERHEGTSKNHWMLDWTRTLYKAGV
jgi:hypothetical protein